MRDCVCACMCARTCVCVSVSVRVSVHVHVCLRMYVRACVLLHSCDIDLVYRFVMFQNLKKQFI